MLKGRKSAVGLDIGGACIKALEITRDKYDYVITGYGQIEVQNEAERPDAIRELFNQCRFRTKKVVDFRRIGGGIVGIKGNPRFAGSGVLGSTTEPPQIVLSNYRNNTSGVFIIGLTALKLPYLGGTLIPNLDIVVSLFGSGADIKIDASGLKNVTLPNLWVQAFYIDAAAQQGVSATSGYRILL